MITDKDCAFVRPETFAAWANRAYPGEQFVYAVGELARGRGSDPMDGKPAKERTAKQKILAETADLVYRYSQDRLVWLFQRRRPEKNKYDYLAIRRNPKHGDIYDAIVHAGKISAVMAMSG